MDILELYALKTNVYEGLEDYFDEYIERVGAQNTPSNHNEMEIIKSHKE